MCLENDHRSFTPAQSRIRAIGPRHLHQAKGRGRGMAERKHVLPGLVHELDSL